MRYHHRFSLPLLPLLLVSLLAAAAKVQALNMSHPKTISVTVYSDLA